MSRRVKKERPAGARRRMFRSPWFHLVLAFVLVALVQGFVVKPYNVRSGSMEPTLQVGDRLLVNRLAYLGATQPASGDVVVFMEPGEWKDTPDADPGLVRTVLEWVGDLTGFGPSSNRAVIKRVIAGPGQTLRCCDAEGHSLLDEEVLPSPDIAYDLPFERGVYDCQSVPASPRCIWPYRVPADSYLVLGDHRNSSSDSLGLCRGVFPAPIDGCVRLVPEDSIIGDAARVVLPPARWGAELDLSDG